MADQPSTVSFTYHQCPDCDFEAITEAASPPHRCPICAQDCGRDVPMHSRALRDDDAVEWRATAAPSPGSANS